ncbi:hypothetical protein ACS0TY_025011 [Phlomoides rotata]
MSTWRIFSDHRHDFRWEITDPKLQKEEICDAVPEDTPRLPSMADLLLIGSSKLLESGGSNVENPPMFRTGLGESVELKHSSIAKARSVLGEIDGLFTDTGHLDGRENGHASLKPMFEINTLKTANMLKSGLHTSSEDVGNRPSEDVVNRPNYMFQTGSGKTVNISSAGLLRAKTLLGLDENCDLEQIQRQSTTTKFLARENPSQLGTQDPRNLSLGNSTKVLTSSSVKFGFQGNESMKFLDHTNTTSEPPIVKFQTAGGRSISVSDDALQ